MGSCNHLLSPNTSSVGSREPVPVYTIVYLHYIAIVQQPRACEGSLKHASNDQLECSEVPKPYCRCTNADVVP